MPNQVVENTEVENRSRGRLTEYLTKEFLFLEQPLPLGSRVLVVVAALILTVVFLFPLWNMTFFSNQYTDGLTLDIYAYHLEGGKTPNRDDLREKVFQNYVKRGDNNDAHDTKKIISEVLKLRAERAKLLGYATHAHWRLENAMAKTPERAMQLMESVWPAAVSRVRSTSSTTTPSTAGTARTSSSSRAT